jgi:hypothetical protein
MTGEPHTPESLPAPESVKEPHSLVFGRHGLTWVKMVLHICSTGPVWQHDHFKRRRRLLRLPTVLLWMH